MYKISTTDAHKRIIGDALESVKLVIEGKDQEVFNSLSEKQEATKIAYNAVINYRKRNLPELPVSTIEMLNTINTKIQNEENLTKEEALILDKALDAYSRLGIGQVGIFYENIQLISGIGWEELVNSLKIEDSQMVRLLICRIFKIPEGSFLSIAGSQTHRDHKIAYEIKKVITRYLSYERKPEGGWGVNFDGPIGISGEKICDIYNVDTGYRIKSGVL